VKQHARCTSNWPYPYNFRNYDFIYAVMNSWFNSFLISYHLYTKSWYEGQALAYRINWERYTQYGGTSGMLFHISGQISNTTGTNSGVENAYCYVASDVIHGFSWGSCYSIFSFTLMTYHPKGCARNSSYISNSLSSKYYMFDACLLPHVYVHIVVVVW
jgi:hypothetical protein